MDSKIIINARFLTQPITGVQRYSVEISRELKKIYSENDVIFVAPNNIIHQTIAKELNVEIVGTHTGHLWEQIDLPLYLNRMGNPLLLCLANTAPLFYRNKISTIHDVAFKVYPETFSKTFLYFYLCIIPQIIRKSRHIITVSEFSKKEIQKYYHIEGDNISVIYNAVSGDFRPSAINSENINPYFLAVSSVNYRKNFLAVLKAYELFKKNTNSKYKLLVIGDLSNDNFNKVDISHYINNPDIVFCGRVSDKELIEYYSNAIAFLYPSLYEGFGIPPIEAQACMCPVLCSSIEPLKEVLGKSALYADPYSIVDIAKKMEMMMNSDYKDELKLLGKENLLRFSWNKSAWKLQEILSKFI